MRVLRAILGRFARFLVRIARTLDPASATAPYWVVPERMAALRQRYPGAPEHWLEFVARRAAVGDPVEPHAPSPDPRPSAEAQLPQARDRDARRSFLRFRERPVVAFSQQDARQKARPTALHIAPANPASSRPGLTFGANSVRNPIANLLRIGRRDLRAPMMQFHTVDSARSDIQDAGPPNVSARREHPTFFPNPGDRPTHRPDTVDAQRRADIQSDLRWPERFGPSAIASNWRDHRPGAARPDPSFRTSDPRWPDLPPLEVDYGPSAAASLDEAILLAEQLGGTWSG
jgi:hypothetical protein